MRARSRSTGEPAPPPWSSLSRGALEELRLFVADLRSQGGPLLSRGDVLAALEAYAERHNRQGLLAAQHPLRVLLDPLLELLPLEDGAVFLLRSSVGRTEAVALRGAGIRLSSLGDEKLLELYESRFAARSVDSPPGSPRVSQAGPEHLPSPASAPDAPAPEDGEPLRLDFLALYDRGRAVSGVEEVGQGLQVLMRQTVEVLCDNPAEREKTLVALLAGPAHRGRRRLIEPERFTAPGSLARSLRQARKTLGGLQADLPAARCLQPLQGLGFAPGWGAAAGSIRETLGCLEELLQDPTEELLTELLGRLPLVERVVIVSPHGWFGQEKVLGRPDTGGQIVYILDQVQGLEQALKLRLQAAGLEAAPRIAVLTRRIPESDGTTCDRRLEPIRGTEGGLILRLPFLDARGREVPQWMSRFEVWPYLEGFARQAERELPGVLGGPADLVVGNYSDGNLVATLLAAGMASPLCTIAHALEKTKYSQADLRWRDYEGRYHFSVQLLADLLAMNAADFVVASTFQEIAGDQRSTGQYESHRTFALPGLYRVTGGIDPFLDKFNILPPGVNEEIFFPFADTGRRDPARRAALERLLFGTGGQESRADEALEAAGDAGPETGIQPGPRYENGAGEETLGTLADPRKVPLLTLARLDRTKNITGLVQEFAASDELRRLCNLLIVAGKVDPARAADAEERDEILRMHELIARHGLEGQIRWLGIHLAKEETGELYRVAADHGGLFVQPARYEAFGLTVLEAMASGLPTFATRHGGPAEIISDGEHGYLLDPLVPGGISGPLLRFLREAEPHPEAWQRVSAAGVGRVREGFTWGRYSRRLLDGTALYGLRRITWGSGERRRIDAYNHLLLRLLFAPRAGAMLPGD